MSKIKPGEVEAINQLRGRLNDIGNLPLTLIGDGTFEQEDFMLLRFLRARDLNLNRAEEMLRKHIQWRNRNKIENILDWVPPSYLPIDEFPYEVTGVDKEGDPVLVIPIGYWDIRSVVERGPEARENYIRYSDQLFFKTFASAKQNQKMTKFIIIMILDNLQAYRQGTSIQAQDAVLETVRTYVANHPETLKQAFIVDAPKVFQVIFNMIKPLLDVKTVGKVTMTTGAKEWRPNLNKLIDPQNLPPRLGGTYHSNFPMLNRTRKANIAPNSIISPPTQNVPGSLTYISLNVPAGRKISIEYNVTTAGVGLRWSFKTVKWDIGFSILYNGKDFVVPYRRLDSDHSTQNGEIVCDREGKYLLEFDNSFSRWRSKVVRYRVEVGGQAQAQGQAILLDNEDADEHEMAHRWLEDKLDEEYILDMNALYDYEELAEGILREDGGLIKLI